MKPKTLIISALILIAELIAILLVIPDNLDCRNTTGVTSDGQVIIMHDCG